MQEKLLIFSAPSGSGKTSIVRHILEHESSLEFSISACSRSPRSGEKDGIDYYFISADEFRQKIKADEFCEWEEVYKDHYYGTLMSELEKIWKKGKHIIFDIDVAGGLNLKSAFGDKALAIFVMPPDMQALKHRLTRRGTDTDEKIKMRMLKASEEMKHSDKFDHIIINNNLDEACSQALILVRDFIKNSEK